MDYRIINIDIILFALSNLILQAEDLILEGDKDSLSILEEISNIAFEEQKNLLSQIPSEDPEEDVISKPSWKNENRLRDIK